MVPSIVTVLIFAIGILGLLLAIVSRRALVVAAAARQADQDLISGARELRLCTTSEAVAAAAAAHLTRVCNSPVHILLDAEPDPANPRHYDISWHDESLGLLEFEREARPYPRLSAATNLEYFARTMLVVASELARCTLVDRQQQTITSLRRLDADRSSLIRHVSHELRTPLTAVIGFIETLLRDDIELSPNQREQLLVAARGGGRRLDRLVHDILQLDSSHSGDLRLDLQPVRLSELIADALTCVDIPHDRSIRVWIDGDDEVSADRLRIVEVINHLVANAVQHGRGEIRIRCARVDQRMVIDVSDDGAGLPRQHVEDAFQPFTTLGHFHDTTGLGLAISRGIIEAHGGSLLYLYPIQDLPHAFRCSLPVEAYSSPDEAKGIALKIRAA